MARAALAIYVRHRVVFKLVTLSFKTKQFVKPSYLSDLLREYQPEHSNHPQLISSSTPTDRFHLKCFTSFSIATPAVWNKQSVNIKSATSLRSFKSRVKNELYSVAYLPPRMVHCHHIARLIHINYVTVALFIKCF